MTAERSLLHDDEAGALQVAHNALGSDSGHVLIGLMDALTAFELQGEGNGVGEVTRLGGRESVGIGHSVYDSRSIRT
jgi:hypothetical protein